MFIDKSVLKAYVEEAVGLLEGGDEIGEFSSLLKLTYREILVDAHVLHLLCGYILAQHPKMALELMEMSWDDLAVAMVEAYEHG